MSSRNKLRQQIRQQRRALSPHQRHMLARQLAQQLVHNQLFRSCEHIACYLANDGEMDLQPVIRRIWAMGKQCYLPVLGEGKEKQMNFAPYRPGNGLAVNRYGIPEPDCAPWEWLSPYQLQLVLMPLVAFDEAGNRLGMGGGYYDRSFAFLNRPFGVKKPHLVGVAYEFQRQPRLPREPWDVPLMAVATEAGVRRIKR